MRTTNKIQAGNNNDIINMKLVKLRESIFQHIINYFKVPGFVIVVGVVGHVNC